MSYRLVDHILVTASDLSDAEFRLLVLLSRHADDDGNRTFPSVTALATASGKQPRAIKYILRRLRLAGWIDVVSRGGGRGRATRYRVNRSPIPLLPLLGTARARRETVQTVAPFPAGAPTGETVQSFVETVQTDVILPTPNMPQVMGTSRVAATAATPNQSRDPVTQKQIPPTPRMRGASLRGQGAAPQRRLRAHEQRRVEQLANFGRARWSLLDDCPHRPEGGAVCESRIACELRQGREVRAGTRALADVHEALRRGVGLMAGADVEPAPVAGAVRRQA